MMKDYAKHSATKEGAGGANVQAAGVGGAGDGAGAGAGQVASPSPAYRAPPFDINNVVRTRTCMHVCMHGAGRGRLQDLQSFA